MASLQGPMLRHGQCELNYQELVFEKQLLLLGEFTTVFEQLSDLHTVVAEANRAHLFCTEHLLADMAPGKYPKIGMLSVGFL